MKRPPSPRFSELLVLFLSWSTFTSVVAPAADGDESPTSLLDARLLRFPDIHEDTIVFCYAGDLWTVSTTGGAARRLTAGEGLELFPRFSHDGRWIAFTGHYDGGSDVYVIPSTGGIPRRLTWYPARVNNDRMGWDNMVIDWTPDGRILFRSQRGPIGGFVGEPYTVAPTGGPVERFPLPESGLISFSPDGKRIAYNRIFRNFRTWKRYRGGMAQDVWIYDLEKKTLDRITSWDGTDTHPLWIGDAIFFVSDREDWRRNLWRYDLTTAKTTRVTRFTDYDVNWPQSGSGKIVFESGGFLHVLDPAAGEPVRMQVSIADDRRFARPRWASVAESITEFGLAPGGQRAYFVARGDIFTVPADKGDTRNVTGTKGARERGVAWSPDGRWIACISDMTGEEELYLYPQAGGAPRKLTSGPPSWHFAPVWSSDSRKLAWADRGLRLWYIDVDEKMPVLVDRAEVWEIHGYEWSPDSMWIAFTKVLGNEMPAIHLYSLDARSITQVTRETERSSQPVFDPGGGYLFFLSDRDVAPVLGHFELNFTVNRMTRPYAVVLRSDLSSPLASGSDEAVLGGGGPGGGGAGRDSGRGTEGEKGPAGSPVAPFRVDLQGIQDRVVAFPVPPGEYGGLRVAQGRLFYLSSSVQSLREHGVKGSLKMFDIARRRELEVLSSIDAYDISPDGGRLIYKRDAAYAIVDAREGAGASDGQLNLSGLRMELDPAIEWTQIFHEVWRLQRDLFYLPDMGNLDWERVRRRYEPLLFHVSHRVDLTYLLGEMVGEMATGHAYVGGGDYPAPERVPVGVLGADLELDREKGLWRFSRILRGQNWIESRRSPLTEPGVNVSEGEYLLAVDGQDLTPSLEPSRLLVQKVGRTVILTVSSKPEREAARAVSVRPAASEADLRYYNWVEDNRRKVDQATGGRVGYIHIPDMQARGLEEFIRQYYPQIRKDGLIVDVRYNGGGFVSQIILERLRRVLVGMSAPREARPETVPDAVFNGPMVALINQYSASDGDLFPHFFRKYGLGPLIGRRTWGGVVGIRGNIPLVDGGYVTVPEFGHYGLEGEWIIENRGVEPDIVVDNLPADELQGKDAQLERAIHETVARLEQRQSRFPPRPPSPDLHPQRQEEGEKKF